MYDFRAAFGIVENFLNRQPTIHQDDFEQVPRTDVVISFAFGICHDAAVLKLVFADQRERLIEIPGSLCYYLRDYLTQGIYESSWPDARICARSGLRRPGTDPTADRQVVG